MTEAGRVYHSIVWRRIARYVKRVRANGACEHCGALEGAIAADGRSVIRLACAHLNGNVHDLRFENLRALCPTCHYFYDQMLRVRKFFDLHPELEGVLGARGGRTAGARAKTQRRKERRTRGTAGALVRPAEIEKLLKPPGADVESP
jgi:hypothetical protein